MLSTFKNPWICQFMYMLRYRHSCTNIQCTRYVLLYRGFRNLYNLGNAEGPVNVIFFYCTSDSKTYFPHLQYPSSLLISAMQEDHIVAHKFLKYIKMQCIPDKLFNTSFKLHHYNNIILLLLCKTVNYLYKIWYQVHK